MANPWDGAYYLHAKYGDPKKAICGLRLFSGPIIIEEDVYSVSYKGQLLAKYERNPIDQIENLNKENENLKTNFAQEIQNNASLQTALTTQEKDNAGLLASVRSLEKQRDDIKTDYKMAEGFAKDLLEMSNLSAEEFRRLSGVLHGLTSENKRLVKELENAITEWKIIIKVGKYAIVKK
jgi:septal ring factor EnvC (AmiA/AmiB activator)